MATGGGIWDHDGVVDKKLELCSSIGILLTFALRGCIHGCLQINDPNGNIVYSRHQSTDERFSFTAETSGVYRFCLRNKMSVPETVEFSLGLSEDEEDEEPAELAQDSKMRNHSLLEGHEVWLQEEGCG